MTRRALISLGTISTIGIMAVFGFSLMTHTDGMVGNCTGAVSTVCPLASFMHVFAHFEAFQHLSLAIVVGLILLAGFTLYFIQPPFFKESGLFRQKLQFARVVSPTVPERLNFVRWLARHEKRDPSDF